VWTGMTDDGYELGKFEAIHRPTELHLHMPGSVPHGLDREPFLLNGVGLTVGSVALHIRRDPTRGRAMDLGVPTWPDFDEEGFRRRFGQVDDLYRVAMPGGAGSVTWTAGLVGKITTLFFILSDPSGFRDGRAAYPDVIRLTAPELPEGLNGSYLNEFACAAV